MQVTPGITLTDTEDITAEDLNLLGTPTVALDSADTAAIVAAVQATLGDGVAGKNYWRNPGLNDWTAGSSPINCPVGVRTLRADFWWVRPNSVVSAVPTYGQTTDTVHQAYLFAAQITGASGVGSVDFGQDISAAFASGLFDHCTVTFDIQNGSGGTFTPVIGLDTCNTFESFGAVTNRITQNTTAVNNGATSTITTTLDTSTIGAALRNGAQIYVRTPSGSLDNVAKFVRIYNLKVEIGSTATARYVDSPTTGTSSSGSGGTTTASGVEREFLDNGNLAELRWGANATVIHGQDVYVAQGWWANAAAGDTLSYIKDTTVPNTLSLYSARLTGDTAIVSFVDFGQNIIAGNAAAMGQPTIFSAYIFNGTGADYAPILILATCNSLDNFGSVTTQTTQTLQVCPNGIWTRVSFPFNGGNFANWNNGARISLRFDTGTLNAGGKTVRIAQLSCQAGSVLGNFVPQPTFSVVGGTPGVATGLSLQSTSSSLLNISADGLVLGGNDGTLIFASNIVLTSVNIAASGLGGLDTGTEAASVWYAIWVVSNGPTIGALLSLSTTAPTMPAGYRYKALVGFVRNDASSNFVPFYKTGSRVHQTPQVLFDSKGPATPGTFEVVSIAAGGGTVLASMIPPGAKVVVGNVAWLTGSGADIVGFAATAASLGQSWIAHQFAFNTGLLSVAPGATTTLYGPMGFRCPVLTPQEFYWTALLSTANKRMEITGYEL